ncbi:MAG: group III truncated hemoglobin [Lautropia sp.]|nr:group III truncated hemoglobin [Lautropia sp.]
MHTAICTEEDIREMVDRFYGRVREDEVLGPIFNGHIDDWDEHLVRLTDFWSSMLLRTGRFEGAPMPKHIALPELSAELFERWLAIFAESLEEHPNQQMARQAADMAERIAQRLWLGYQMAHRPGQPAAPLINTARYR